MPPLAHDVAAWDAAVVPAPQLVEEFEATTTAGLLPSVVTGSVALSTVGPKFGAQRAVVQSSGGFKLRYPHSQLPIAITRFMLGVWVRLDAQPPATAAVVRFLEVQGVQPTDLYLGIRPAEATAGLSDRFEWRLGNAVGPPFALPLGVWRYIEVRAGLGTLSPGQPGYQYRYWHMATRLHGVAQHEGNFVHIADSELNPLPPRQVELDYPATPAAPGMIMGLDRWWWWVGTDEEPMPQWWSSVLGWDGTYPLASISARLRPGYHAELLTRNDVGVL